MRSKTRLGESSRHATLVGMLLLGCVMAMAAEQATELSEEFLEYLASMESDDENWTDFATTSPKPAAVTTVAAKASTSASSSSSSMSAASSAAKAGP